MGFTIAGVVLLLVLAPGVAFWVTMRSTDRVAAQLAQPVRISVNATPVFPIAISLIAALTIHSALLAVVEMLARFGAVPGADLSVVLMLSGFATTGITPNAVGQMLQENTLYIVLYILSSVGIGIAAGLSVGRLVQRFRGPSDIRHWLEPLLIAKDKEAFLIADVQSEVGSTVIRHRGAVKNIRINSDGSLADLVLWGPQKDHGDHWAPVTDDSDSTLLLHGSRVATVVFNLAHYDS